MTFRIHPLRLAPFRPLFALDDPALAALGAPRMIAGSRVTCVHLHTARRGCFMAAAGRT